MSHHESIIKTLTDLKEGWEIVLHRCPRLLLPTFREIFPDLRALPASDVDDKLILMVVWQRTKRDMSGFSEPVEQERSEKTTDAISFGTSLADAIKAQHSNDSNSSAPWFDFIDPSSGLPFLGQRGTTVFIETDDAVMNLGYELLEFGCCKAVNHHAWSTKCFLTTLLTTASPEQIEQAVLKVTSLS